tara:strand:+ start:1170 stop:1550 length:381 start_codon:yes stop_codon:yes gene_type:complete
MTSVLIADDDEDIRELFDDELMESGFDVYLAHNGVEAMEMLRTFVPEVVLVDLKMPEMDGFELMRQMREFNPTIPIIVVSGKTTSGIEADVLSSGASYFLAKPVDTNDLIKTIYRTIHHRVSDLGA